MLCGGRDFEAVIGHRVFKILLCLIEINFDNQKYRTEYMNFEKLPLVTWAMRYL